ncbi:hypothetical protein [Aeromonas jandaei]|uniref:hypothetical protein n=1 Tax=Aeromonas jandaei TaxID=650 RepID=UPI0039884EAE
MAEEHITLSQYITWFMAIIGWLITLIVARLVLRKNARNSWIGDIKKSLIELEDESIIFWMGPNSNTDLLELKKLRRKIKEITALAMEIKEYGGPDYPKHLYLQLRQSVTTEKYHQDNLDMLKRNLPSDDDRINTISDICSDLRVHYRRER